MITFILPHCDYVTSTLIPRGAFQDGSSLFEFSPLTPCPRSPRTRGERGISQRGILGGEAAQNPPPIYLPAPKGAGPGVGAQKCNVSP